MLSITYKDALLRSHGIILKEKRKKLKKGDLLFLILFDMTGQ